MGSPAIPELTENETYLFTGTYNVPNFVLSSVL